MNSQNQNDTCRTKVVRLITLIAIIIVSIVWMYFHAYAMETSSYAIFFLSVGDMILIYMVSSLVYGEKEEQND